MKYLLFSILLIGNSFSQEDKECSLLSNEHISYSKIHQDLLNHTIIIQNFNDFEELNLNCVMKFEILSLIFIPNKEVFFDNTFTYARLIYNLKFEQEKSIIFLRIKGFNQKSFEKKFILYGGLTFVLQSSKFDFYLNGTKIDETSCNLANFNNSINLFGPIQFLETGSDVYFSKKTCPYVFMNTKLSHITFDQITNSLIVKNQLGFLDINQTNNFDLNNKKMIFLNLGLAFEDLNTRLIDKYVFKYINRLIIWGVVESIQEDLFLHFKNLSFLFLNLDNFGSFLHKSDNKWMKHLNSDVKIDLENKNQVYKNLEKSLKFEIYQSSNKNNSSKKSFGNAYMYPDEDFCLFKYFPHDQLVYTPIMSGDRLQCTCTLIWLIQYINFYDTTKFHNENSDYFITLYYQEDFKSHSILVCLEKDLKAQIKECNFPKRLNNCDGYKVEKKYSINDFEILFDLKWLELIIFMFLQPIICFVGIVTNLLSILTLKQKIVANKNEKDYSMYKHIVMNSVFNLIYCILTLSRLMNVCIFTTTIFCSSVFQYKFTQYFRIIFIYYIGNIIKLCCNISYISFSLSRFTISTNTKSKILLKFESINLKTYYTIVIILCSLFSVFKCFQYQINEIYNTYKSFPLESYDIDSCRDDNFKCKLFKIFNVINDFIIYMLFFFIDIAIDVYLVKSSKKNLENKKKITNDKKILATAFKSNKKITRMVVLNGLLFLIAYTPEFISRTLLLLFDKYLFNFCFLYYSCKNLIDITEFFTFFSIAFQFFMYKKFNNKFNEQFSLLKKKITTFLND